jgi:hypothetical protein
MSLECEASRENLAKLVLGHRDIVCHHFASILQSCGRQRQPASASLTRLALRKSNSTTAGGGAVGAQRVRLGHRAGEMRL